MRAERGGAPRLGAIVAVDAEAGAILADGRFEWEAAEAGTGGGCALYESRSLPLTLALSGVGKVFASWAAAALVGRRCELLVSLGSSGGLGSEPVGSLYLVREFVEHDMLVTALGIPPYVTPFAGMEGPVISALSPAAEALALEALAASGLEAGSGEGKWARAAAGDRFIGDAAEARALREATGASLCDMESAAVAKLCAYRAGVDFFALRSVSDNADHLARLSWAEQARLSSRDFDAYLWALARVVAGGRATAAARP
jgi:nucleoside phosphorylase